MSSVGELVVSIDGTNHMLAIVVSAVRPVHGSVQWTFLLECDGNTRQRGFPPRNRRGPGPR